MKSRYLSNPDYNFEKVNRASMACGPMVKWAIAQVTKNPMNKGNRLSFQVTTSNKYFHNPDRVCRYAEACRTSP